MTNKIDLDNVLKTGYLVPAKNAPQQKQETEKVVLDFLHNIVKNSPMMFHYTKDREGTDGQPLITIATDRGFGRGYQDTNEQIPIDVLQNKLKEKNLDKDMRKTIELEIKRQQQDGYLTPEQQIQWKEIRDRKIEEGRAGIAEKLNLKL